MKKLKIFLIWMVDKKVSIFDLKMVQKLISQNLKSGIKSFTIFSHKVGTRTYQKKVLKRFDRMQLSL